MSGIKTLSRQTVMNFYDQYFPQKIKILLGTFSEYMEKRYIHSITYFCFKQHQSVFTSQGFIGMEGEWMNETLHVIWISCGFYVTSPGVLILRGGVQLTMFAKCT